MTIEASTREAVLGLRMASRNLLRRPRRTALVTSAISLGIVAMILAGGFIEWNHFALREATIRSHLGHLQVVRPGYYTSGKADPFRYLLPESGEAADVVSNAGGIATVAPRISFSGLVSHDETTLSFIAEGVDPGKEKDLSQSLTMMEGENLSLDDPQTVILGLGLARNLDVRVGERVVLLVTPASGAINAVELTVRGTFSTVTKAYDDVALRIPIQTARKLLRVQGAHAWIVLLDDTERTNETTAALQAKLPSREFQVVPWYDLADFYNKTVALFSKQIDVVRFIIAAIIVLGISNSMMMSVMERTGEVGTAMALGADKRRVLRDFLLEGVLLGVVGGVAGVAIALPLAALISAIGIPMPAPPGMSRGFIAQIRVTPTIAFEGVVLAFVTAVLASVYPAWRASRLVIVDALRHNR